MGGKSAGHTPVGSSPFTTQFSSPTHNQTPTTGNNIRVPPSSAQTSNTTSPNHMKSPNNTAGFGMSFPSTQTSVGSSSQNRPDYSRSHFEQPKVNTQQQQKSSDIFADILGEQGYKFTSKGNQGPRSINEMRKEDLIKDMDPKKVKIMDWVCNVYT